MKKFLLMLSIIAQAASAFESDCKAVFVWQEQKKLYELWQDLKDRQYQEKKKKKNEQN